jgi:hypothetical protein
MAMSSVWTKFKLPDVKEIVVVNAPASFETELENLDGVKVLRRPAGTKQRFDFVLLFATNSRELESAWKQVIPTLKTEAALWVGYPKKSSGIQSDLAGMSEGWTVYAGSPWQPVAMISINDTWTGTRFRYSPNLEKKRQDRPDEEIRDMDGTVVVDRVNRMVYPPRDFVQVLSKHPAAKAFFDALSFTNKKEYVIWITQAKQKETRDKRLTLALEKLVSEKKNPSEK